MKDNETFTVRVTDDRIAKEDVEEGQGYIIFTEDNEIYYVLKPDGTTERFDNADGFDELANTYKWTLTYVYAEDGIERYLIHPFTHRTSSLALNNPGQSLVLEGTSNIKVIPNGEGYTFEGYNNTKLTLTGETGNKTFAGSAEGSSAVMYIYEQGTQDEYKFSVVSSDFAMGKVEGRDSVGVLHENAAEFTSITTTDKMNSYTLRALPQSQKYIFDHWELNGEPLYQNNSPEYIGSTINPETLLIPYAGSRLEAVFKVNPEYIPPDSEKEGQSFSDDYKQGLKDWLDELKSKQVPLNPEGCDKTAEVYDYENRIYRVDLTAQSSLSTFDGIIDLGFILDASGSMQFPSKLSPEAGKNDFDINHINDNDYNKRQLDQNKYHYLIADKAGTATVYRLFYGSEQEESWYGTTTRTGWWAVDASYADTDRRRFFIGSNSKFSNDAAGMKYQIYVDGDNGKKRLDYLQSSINGTISDLNDILKVLSLAQNNTANPDVKIAYNTFCATILHSQHEFSSVKDGIHFAWDTNGGTGTDLALNDARQFAWGTNKSTKNYAVLITDGAPQAGGRAIPNETVIAAANQLKKGKDGIENTDDDVTLITVGLSMGDVKRGSVLLYDLADRDSDNEKMFYKAESGDELEYVLYEIIQKIMIDATVQGNVTDTVGEAFYPVDKATGMPLKPGDKIDLEGNKIDESYAGFYGTIDQDGRTIHWNNQDFNHTGWHGTVYVKAKEDFLGGTAVRTNAGDAVVEAVSYTTPSNHDPVPLKPKTPEDKNYVVKIDNLETPLVNVNELQFSELETEWNVYLGTEVDPGKQMEELYKKLYVEEVVTKAEDIEPAGNPDRLPDHVFYEEGDEDNNLFPLKESISDGRESEIPDSRKPVTFTMNDLLKKLTAGKDYDWWDYNKGEPNYPVFFERALSGITLDYDEYGINEKEHKLDDNTVRHDASNIVIKLEKQIDSAEINEGTDPLSGSHPTQVIGDAVEKYTLTVKYAPDYEILPEGQGGKSLEDFHVGGYGTTYNGHAPGTDIGKAVHTINVYAKPLEVRKVDPEGNSLTGAKFGIYRVAKDGETGVSLTEYNDELTGSYILVSEGISDGNGIVRLADTGNTAETRLVEGETYYLIETDVPAGGYVRDSTVRIVTVVTQKDGSYTDLDHQPITAETVNAGEAYNWSQGVRTLVDGTAIVGNEEDPAIEDRELEDNEYAYRADQLVFRTRILNLRAMNGLDVTKRWTDEKGVNKAKNGHFITFKVTRKNGPEGTPEDVDLRNHITVSDTVKLSNDGKQVTLYYSEETGWPTAQIRELLRYTDNSGKTEWIYEVQEITCNPQEKAKPEDASYEESVSEDGIRTITIVNIEKRKTEIEVDKKWLASGEGEVELETAPEESITFEVYRVAHIPCRHVYDEGIVTKEPTCEKTGERTYTCTKCGDTYTDLIPANGHSWSEWTVRKEATYTEDGIEVRTCSVCKKEETRPITMLPHDHVWDDLSIITEAACETEGKAYRKCSLCDKVNTEDTITIPALGHLWNEGVTSTEPTCETEGKKIFTCSRCGKTEERTIAALGHDFIVYDDPAAACESAGTRHHVCRNDSSHNYDETIPATGHNWGEWETYIEATPTQEGENRRYCLNDSSHYESQTVPKTGETFGETGLPVDPYEWPDTSNFDSNQMNNTVVIEPTGIIKYTDKNGKVLYAIIYQRWSGNYNQLVEGPGGGAMQNSAVVLTGTIKTKSDINSSNQITPIKKGDMFRTDDGTYYVFLKNDGTANNMNNGFNQGDWYKIPVSDSSDNRANNSNVNSSNSLNGVNNVGGKASNTSATVAKMKAARRFGRQTNHLLNAEKNGASAEETAARRSRLAKLLNTEESTIIFRSEMGDQSNIDVWEYVDSYAGSGEDWKWHLDNLDAFDDEGNEYTYYVIETSPTEAAYQISYENNGKSDSDEEKVITIKNKQIAGGLTVTKAVEGTDAKGTYRIAVKNAEGHYFDLNGNDTGTDPYYVEFSKNESKTWNNLPEGTYTVEEENADVNGYTWTVSGTGEVSVSSGTSASATVTNSYEEKPGSLKITKTVTVNGNPTAETAADGIYTFTVWNADGTEQITTKKDGTPIGELTITVTGGTALSDITVDGLEPGDYVIKEGESDNHHVMINQSAGGYNSALGGIPVTVSPGDTAGVQTAAFTNNYETVDASVKKIWNDSNDMKKKRPAELTVTLYADGITTDRTVTLKAPDWNQETITGLPKYKDGTEIEYYWIEENMPAGYFLSGQVEEFPLPVHIGRIGLTVDPPGVDVGGADVRADRGVLHGKEFPVRIGCGMDGDNTALGEGCRSEEEKDGQGCEAIPIHRNWMKMCFPVRPRPCRLYASACPSREGLRNIPCNGVPQSCRCTS